MNTMTKKMEDGRWATAQEFLKTNKDKPNRWIARMLHKMYPNLFTSVDAARSFVRYAFGMHGNRSRSKMSEERHVMKSAGMENLTWPDEVVETQWQPYKVPAGGGKWPIIADVHLPFYDKSTFLAMIDFLLKIEKQIEGVIFNGDILDQYSCSWWPIDPSVTTLESELEAGRQFFSMFNSIFPKVKKVYKKANHEYRYEKTLMQNRVLAASPSYREMTKFERLLEADGNDGLFKGYEIVEPWNMIYHKDLAILHGDEIGRGASVPVNPARTAFLRTKSCCWVNHFHSSSQHVEQDIWGTQIVTKSGGCLCNLHPRWNPAASLKWNHGFGILDTGKKWSIENYRILSNKEIVQA